MSSHRRQPSRPAPRVVLIGLLVLAGGAIWLWNGPGDVQQPPLRAFEMKRDAGAEWPPLPIHDEAGGDEPGLSFRFSVHAGSTQTETNSKIVAAVASTAGARFASRSVLVVPQTADDLTAAVTWRVLGALQQDPVLERIACQPPGTPVRGGGIAPDMVLRIASSAADGPAVGERAKFEVRLTDHYQRPLTLRSGRDLRGDIEYSIDLEVESKQTFEGIATRGARFEGIADEIAQALAGQLQKKLAELRQKHGVLPALPAVFVPEYREGSDLAAELEGVAPFELRASWRAVFLHNETWWRGVVPLPEAEALARVQERLADRGFELVESQGDKEMMFERGAERLAALVEPTEQSVIGSVVVEQNTESTPILLRLRIRASDERVARAIDATLTDHSDLGLLAAFRSQWNDAQEERALAVLSERAQRPEAMLLRSSLRARRGDVEGAIADLRHAWLDAQVTVRAGDVVDDIEKAAKQLGHELDASPPSEDELRRAGFVALSRDQPLERELATADSVRAFFVSGDEIALVGAGLYRADDGRVRGAIRTAHGAGAHEAFDLGMQSHTTGLPSGGSLRCEFLDDPIDGVAVVRIEVRGGF